MAAEDITLDELQAAFRDAGFTGDESDEGKTMDELAEALGCSKGRAHDLIKRANKLGILQVGKRAAVRIDGGACRVPVYSFVTKKAATTRKAAKK